MIFPFIAALRYLNGHDDIAAGAVIGSAEWITKITHRSNHLGGALDGFLFPTIYIDTYSASSLKFALEFH